MYSLQTTLRIMKNTKKKKQTLWYGNVSTEV